MNSVKLLVCATALVLLWGCTTSRLSDEYFVQTTRDVGDAREVIGQAEVPLGAGDVLYVRRQLSHLDEVSGVADFSLGESAALALIPLRRVGPDASCESHGGSGRLYEYEREFLVAVLASNSSETAEPADRDERSSMLENLLLRNEVALWNCLVENLTIQRPPAGDEGHAGSVLELRVNMDGLLTPLAADSPERARFKTGMQVFPADVVNDVSSSEVGTETQTDTSNAVRTGVESGPRFEIVTAEMDGLSILHPGWPERQWSLLEWDQAGVLQDRHKETSRLLVLKFSK